MTWVEKEKGEEKPWIAWCGTWCRMVQIGNTPNKRQGNAQFVKTGVKTQARAKDGVKR